MFICRYPDRQIYIYICTSVFLMKKVAVIEINDISDNLQIVRNRQSYNIEHIYSGLKITDYF